MAGGQARHPNHRSHLFHLHHLHLRYHLRHLYLRQATTSLKHSYTVMESMQGVEKPCGNSQPNCSSLCLLMSTTLATGVATRLSIWSLWLGWPGLGL